MSGYWRDKNGEELDVDYMSDKHLINCIRYIKKCIDKDDEYLEPPVYYELVKEYKRRIGLVKRG